MPNQTLIDRSIIKLNIYTHAAAHTIGVAHCTSFSKRLYNFTGAGDQDPSLDPAFAKQLAAVCKPGNVASVEPLDALTPVKFDNGYYKSVAAHQALLGSDAGLIDDSLTGAYVRFMTNDTNLDTFFADFAVSMINMGRVGVLTGTDGQIRPTCGIYVD